QLLFHGRFERGCVLVAPHAVVPPGRVGPFDGISQHQDDAGARTGLGDASRGVATGKVRRRSFTPVPRALRSFAGEQGRIFFGLEDSLSKLREPCARIAAKRPFQRLPALGVAKSANEISWLLRSAHE